MRKIICSICTAILICISFLSIAEAEYFDPETYTCGDYEYVILQDGSAQITFYSGDDETVVFPERLDGKTVTSLAEMECDSFDVTSVVLPDTIIHIESNPFADWYSLNEINVSPGNPAFMAVDNVLYDKSGNTIICYPQGIEDAVYEIPDGIKSIGDGAFSEHYFLHSVIVPDGTVRIGNDAFAFCSTMSSIEIPNSVIHFDSNPFCGTHAAIILNNDHPTLTVYDHMLLDREQKKLVFFPNSRDTVICEIPEETEIIGPQAFSYCEYLESVVIPDSVKRIEDYAFYWCASMKAIRLPNGLESIGACAFSGCDELRSIYIPASVTYIGNNAFEQCGQVVLAVVKDSYAEQYAIDNHLEYMDSSSSQSRKKETYFDPETNEHFEYDVIDNQAILLGYWITPGAESPKTILVPAVLNGYPLKEIGWSAFDNDKITDSNGRCFDSYQSEMLIIPEGVTTIQDGAFTDCTVRTVMLPSTISNITSSGLPVYNGFYAEIQFENGNEYFASENGFLIDRRTSTLLYCAPSSGHYPLPPVKRIETNLRNWISASDTLVIPDTVEYVGPYSLYEDMHYKKIILPSSVIELADYAFCYNSLEEIIWGDGLKKIGAMAFVETGIQTVTIPESVEWIGFRAFTFTGFNQTRITMTDTNCETETLSHFCERTGWDESVFEDFVEE